LQAGLFSTQFELGYEISDNDLTLPDLRAHEKSFFDNATLQAKAGTELKTNVNSGPETLSSGESDNDEQHRQREGIITSATKPCADALKQLNEMAAQTKGPDRCEKEVAPTKGPERQDSAEVHSDLASSSSQDNRLVISGGEKHVKANDTFSAAREQGPENHEGANEEDFAIDLEQLDLEPEREPSEPLLAGSTAPVATSLVSAESTTGANDEQAASAQVTPTPPPKVEQSGSWLKDGFFGLNF
jgi:hypothetical protein